VERFAMSRVVELERHDGCETIVGTYIRRSKNAMARESYAQFGFELLQEREDGGLVWRFQVPLYQPRQVYVGEAA
jgi:predicted enzyme involved in methoxymalonyl-ACP biosynthesis